MNKLISVSIVLVAAGCIAGGQKARKSEVKKSMKTVVNNLGAEIAVTPRIRTRENLRVVLTLSNESQAPFRLNAMYLNAPSLILNFFDSNGKPLLMGPPPVPRVDDGVSDRVVLSPDKPLIHTFPGALIFGSRLNPGRYTVSFIYSNQPGHPGEWVGSIETAPLEFEVVSPELPIWHK